MSPSIGDCALLDLPKIPDPRGNLTVIESGEHVPFLVRRAYWVYDVPGGAVRTGHAYRELQEFVVALSGSFDVVLDDGADRRVVSLNRSYVGLHVPQMIWRAFENFSTNAVALVLASRPYSEDDYIRDYDSFRGARQEP